MVTVADGLPRAGTPPPTPAAEHDLQFLVDREGNYRHAWERSLALEVIIPWDLGAVQFNKSNTPVVSDVSAEAVAARMAESVRAVLNTNAQALLFLPEGKEPFSICDWIRHQDKPGSILFITSSHNELVLNRALLSLWMNLAVHTLMRLPRTRDLRTWFFFDEVHALHRLPAIEDGMQTARGFGGALAPQPASTPSQMARVTTQSVRNTLGWCSALVTSV